MQPNIHIRKVEESYFDYSVSTPAGVSSYTREGLHSIAECLHDAANALGVNFKFASVVYGGAVLGSWLVATMEYDTLAVATAVQTLLTGPGQGAGPAGAEVEVAVGTAARSGWIVDEPYPRHWLRS